MVGLLEGEANCNLVDKDDCTPLCISIREDRISQAYLLLRSNVDVNLGGGILGSALHLAVVKNEIGIVKALIQKGADVNKQDACGQTPLH